jgi:PPOX class probable FMN-dependent enzyme
LTQIELTDGRIIDTLQTIDDLRGVIGQPGSLAVRKDIGRIDSNFAGYIARSPFMLLSTYGESGTCDVSPRGDKPGFAKILDEAHLALPERPGNRRADSLQNIMETGRVALLFLIPGMGETLRINGTAAITRDSRLLESMAVDGKPPLVSIVVTVEEAYLHCPKAFLRSQLWNAGAWPDPEERPSVACIYQDQLSLEHVPIDAIQASLAEDEKHLW